LNDIKEEKLVDTIKRWIILGKKIHKFLTRNKIPEEYHAMKAMKDRLEKEEEQRLQMNKMRERIKALQKKKRDMANLKRIERHMKIRKFLHLPYKTFNEMDLFKESQHEDL
jgi:hypothetical protein